MNRTTYYNSTGVPLFSVIHSTDELWASAYQEELAHFHKSVNLRPGNVGDVASDGHYQPEFYAIQSLHEINLSESE